MFDIQVVRQPSDEVSQDKKVAAHGGESLADRDITEYEWAMHYVESNKKVVLLTTRIKGRGQLTITHRLVTATSYDWTMKTLTKRT